MIWSGKPINPCRLLFTRSQSLFDPFIPAFTQAGGTLYPLPTLEITPRDVQAELNTCFEGHSSNTAYIFVSRHAIEYTGISLKKATQFPQLTCICLGPGSKQALMQQGIPEDRIIMPLSPPYETERLLEHPFFTGTRLSPQQHYCIFRGPPGRTLLQARLRETGATVQEIMVYNRQLPKLTPALQTQWEMALRQHNATLVSSAEGLSNLITRVKAFKHPAFITHLLNQPLLLPSRRIGILAKSLGFRYIIETGSLETQSVLHALKSIFSSFHFFR